MRPLFTKFAAGNFTSGFGIRWGVQHLGVDVAAPIGTPIYAVADATVLEAGPASGFGMWVRLLHDDGTVTIYGHVDTATVSAGQRVMAGDQIATVGNRGFSTGPHCHFEVWLNGVDKIDPSPGWPPEASPSASSETEHRAFTTAHPGNRVGSSHSVPRAPWIRPEHAGMTKVACPPEGEVASLRRRSARLTDGKHGTSRRA